MTSQQQTTIASAYNTRVRIYALQSNITLPSARPLRPDRT